MNPDLPVFGVVKNASSLRPWQVLEVDGFGCSVTGSFKTRAAALSAANALNSSLASSVLESLEEVDDLLSEGTILGDFSRIKRRFEEGTKWP